ncbi:MAG: hypothetical protein HQK51_10000 [Oligoflexia bacterium]|nr:hypothetical protein [Oligoflexia bacterium]
MKDSFQKNSYASSMGKFKSKCQEHEQFESNHSYNNIHSFESIQMLNTAIIKSREKKIDQSYEERLRVACESPAIQALNIAINFLANNQRISCDQAAVQIIDLVHELDSVWHSYVMMEGIDRLKDLLSSKVTQNQ